MCVCARVSLCVHLCLCLWGCVCLYASVGVSMYLCVCACMSVSVALCVCPQHVYLEKECGVSGNIASLCNCVYTQVNGTQTHAETQSLK